MALAVTSIDISTVSDDGGALITATGTFDVTRSVNVIVDPTGEAVTCYSGVADGGEACVSLDGTTLTFISPRMIEGTFNVRFRYTDASATVNKSNFLTIVHRTYSTPLYGMRSLFAAPRDPGPLSVAAERYGSSTTPDDLLRAILSSIADAMMEGFGFLMTRTTAAYTVAGGTLTVESTERFPVVGSLATPRGVWSYTGVTATSFTGVTGDEDSLPSGTVITDASRSVTELDLLRRSFFISTADGSELDILGRNYGFARPRGVSTEVYREMIRVVCWSANQTLYAVELLLDALYGPSGWDAWEDPDKQRATLYVSVPAAQTSTPEGSTYLIGQEPFTAVGGETTHAVDYTPSIVYGIWSAEDPQRVGTNYLLHDLSGSTTFHGDGANGLDADAVSALFVVGDVTHGVIVENVASGVRSAWTIVTRPNNHSITVKGRTRRDGRILDSDLTRMTVPYPTFAPWMAGEAAIQVVGGTGHQLNIGSYTILDVISPFEVEISGPFQATELGVIWRLMPLFDAGAGSYNVSVYRYSIAAKTITFTDALAAGDYLIDYSTSRTDGQLQPNVTPKVNASPFYLYDAGSIVSVLLRLILAAGIKPEVVGS